MSKTKAPRYVRRYFLVAMLAGLGWCSYALVRHVRTDRRFDVREVIVTGLNRVDRSQVIAKTGLDSGTNIFKVDLDEIGTRVEELDWVREAVVRRVLPAQIIIHASERKPVGLARIHGEIYQFDSDGVILDPDPLAGTSFPILDGLRLAGGAINLTKVGRYRAIVQDLGQAELSEVHISDEGEVSVVTSTGSLLIHLGEGDFADRWMKYLQLKNQIEHQYPNAVRVDLRFKNQVIIGMKDDDDGEQIVWDAEKKAL